MNALPVNTKLQGGNFTVGQPLGQGGFGITYYGGDLKLRRYVAIKEFLPTGCARQNSLVQPGATLDQNDFARAKDRF